MIHGLCITPTQLGRIMIGRIVEKNGKSIPEKADHITVTGNSQSDRKWGEHPVMAELRKAEGGAGQAETKLRSIPVRILFDRVENNFKAVFTCFDNKGKQICVGNGDKAKRRVGDEIKEEPCQTPDRCKFGQENRCKLFGRAMVGIEGEWQKNPLAGFMFRTTSWNSVKQLNAQLNYYHAMTGGRMAGMPCNLRMRVKSTSASMRSPFYYLDLEPRGSLLEAAKEALKLHQEWEEAGMNRELLEEAVEQGINNSAFTEDDDGDGREIVQEFGMTAGAPLVDPETGAALEESGGEVISPEQAAVATALINASGRPLERINSFLGRAEKDPIATLTPEQFGRLKQSLQPMTSKTMESSAAQSSAQAASAPAQPQVPKPVPKDAFAF
jgi:hypothetical protein